MANEVFISNNESVAVDEITCTNFAEFRSTILDACSEKTENPARISAYFAMPLAKDIYKLFCIISNDEEGQLQLVSTCPDTNSIYSLVNVLPQVHLFEREMAENFGLEFISHPNIKPVRFLNNNYINNSEKKLIGDMPFFAVEGDDIHEVAVGPVHAGIIEPGHFRFQCYGEHVLNLEISLGYQHRGIESAILKEAEHKRIHYIETCAGDTTVGHTLAYCQGIEALSKTRIHPRAMAIRAIALELERIANHVGDLGALANDVGYLPTAAYCGRLRGDFLNITASICGNRFGRRLIVPGGVNYDISEQTKNSIINKIEEVAKELKNAIELLWKSETVLMRFEDTGKLTLQDARALGLVGPAARACGLTQDVRQDHPSEIFCFNHIPSSHWHTGDVFGRAYVRWLEVKRSYKFILQLLDKLPPGEIKRPIVKLQANSLTVNLVEGWRGEICHVAITNSEGDFAAYKIVDPSFHNWSGLALALRNQQISDFPLCNKSFNLSYCGHDL